MEGCLTGTSIERNRKNMEDIIGCSGTTEETMEEIIPSIMSALSFNGLPEDNSARKSSTDSVISRRRRRARSVGDNDAQENPSFTNVSRESSFRRRHSEQRIPPNPVEKSSTRETEEENSFQDLSPPTAEAYSGRAEVDQKEKSNSALETKSKEYLSFLRSPNMNDHTSSLNSRDASSADIDDSNHSKIGSSIMSVLSMVDESIRSAGSPYLRSEEANGSGGFPSIRNVLSMNDGDKDGTEHQAYPFMRNVFSMNDIEYSVPDRPATVLKTNNIQGAAESRKLSLIDRIESNSRPSTRKRDNTGQIIVTRAYEIEEHYLESIFYVSISAILGSVFRTYMARIFGADCEADGSFNDFLTPFASNICVTNGGRSEQTGGALFIDFPANVLGSFLMGVITPNESHQRGKFPWLHKDHPLQRDEVFHASLATGFCGCLTTFASWNTQMIVMLDGTYCELGSQVVTVLFGYFLGVIGAMHGFQFGRQCGMWMHNFRHRKNVTRESNDEPVEVDDASSSSSSVFHMSIHEGVELVDDDNVKLKPVPSHLHKIPLFLAALGFLVAFILGDIISGIEFYRGMIVLWILSPVGSLLRWKLSNINNKTFQSDGGEKTWHHWIPWGTILANMLATILSASMEGINDRYFSEMDATSSLQTQWIDAMIFALKTGVAGSLSTVSTMVKESVLLSERYPGTAKSHFYLSMTCLSGCLLGLAIYATTIRINT